MTNDLSGGDYSLAHPGSNRAEIHRISVESLIPDNSLRRTGVNANHVSLLAECYDSLPPLLVHRSSMRVLDGNHRLMAAKLRDEATVSVCFFEGDFDAALIAAIRANATHGLPLTLADRRAAAGRLIAAHRDWSDRKIAEAVGLSPKTVGVVRKRSSEEFPQPDRRLGRDGRRRSIVRRRRQRSGPHGPGAVTRSSADQVVRLMRDPSMRQSENGRQLLRLLDLHLTKPQRWEALIEGVPAHRAESVAELAKQCASIWAEFSDLVARSDASGDGSQAGTR